MEKFNHFITSVAVLLSTIWYQEYRNLNHNLKELSYSMNKTVNANHSLLIFNQVPKTGSENMIHLIDLLAEQNNFQNISANPEITINGIFEQIFREYYVTHMFDFNGLNYSKIAYDKYMNFLNFEEFNRTNPIYVSMVRNPVERVISWYYYHRQIWHIIAFESDFPPKYYKESFEDCVLNQREPCQFLPNTSIIADDVHTQKSQVSKLFLVRKLNYLNFFLDKLFLRP